MIKLIIKLILLATLAGGGYYGYQQLVAQRQLVQRENEATQLFNDEQFSQAAETFEKLRQNLNGENRERVEKKLAQCYLALSKNPSLDINAQAEYAAKALKLDPQADIGKTMKRYIQTVLEPENQN
ncbi:MAG: hypothetical protein ACOCUY_02195 [Verrucomicrobiota bacterium]